MRLARSLGAFGLATAIAASVAPARADGFSKGPWIQALARDAVTVKVELTAEAPVTIELSLPGGSKREVVDADARRYHAVRVEGLTPGTSYGYVVRAGEARSDPGRFTTAPAVDRPFRFLAYGDSRSDPTAHAAVVRAILAAPSDFLVHTGDMVLKGDMADEWDGFFRAEGAVLRDRCLFACVGNHELAGDRPGGISFLRYFGPEGDGRTGKHLYGSFRWSNTRFFLLNAMDEWTGEERAWLASELEAAAGEAGLLHRIAVLHHGPFSSGPHGGNPRLAAGEVLSLLRDKKVDLILAGHDHIYERGEGQGLKYVISGGAGAPLYAREHRAPETLVFEAVHHFLEVSVDGDAIRILARRVSGGVIEACGFRGSGPWECDAPSTAEPASASSPLGAPSPPPSPAPGGAASCRCEAPGAPFALWPAPLLAAVALAGGWLRRAARRPANHRSL